MRTVKYPLMVALVTALSVGLVYSQVCRTACAFYGCLPPLIGKNSPPEQPSAGCSAHDPVGHERGEGSTQGEQSENGLPPQSQGSSPDSHDCPAHADQTALVSAAAASASVAMHPNLLPVDGEFYIEDGMSFGLLADGPSLIRSDRSPPPRTVRVLRI